MNDDQLLRFSRHIMLPEVGIEGQQRLLDATALIVGLGGLGSPAAMYLAAAGVGRLILADFDRVDTTNLQRQVIHRTADIGRPKVESARDALFALNPACTVETIASLLSDADLDAQVARADVVLDCTDNFNTRFAINAACVRHGRPLVSGAAIRWEGQVAVFRGRPCYRCLYGEGGVEEETCTANGVLAPVVGVIGSLQAVEAIKVLTGAGDALTDRLLVVDLLHQQFRTLRLRADPGCPVCG